MPSVGDVAGGIGKLVGGAIAVQALAAAWVWSFGPHGWTQPKPQCDAARVCLVIAGLEDDVTLGVTADGQFGLDARDDTAQRLSDDFIVTLNDGAELQVLRYPVEIDLPQNNRAHPSDRFARSLTRARSIGQRARADLVVIGRVINDDNVSLVFVDPSGGGDTRPIPYHLGDQASREVLLRRLSVALAAIESGISIPEGPLDALPVPDTPRITDAKPPSAGPSAITISDPIAPAPEAPAVAHSIVPAQLSTRITAEMAARYYPSQARGEGGRASVRCQVAINGALHGCTVLSETPNRRGFGRAALRVVERHTGTPEFRDGQAVPDGDVTVVVTFNPPAR